jgi:hypothetical protein
MLCTIRRCYHHIEMRPETIGRVLGTGLRVAGRIAGQRIARQHIAPGVPAGQPGTVATMPGRADGQAAGRTARRASGSLARGVGGFLRPFARVGSILWLEVTGVFFFLPVAVFTPNLWRMRASWQHGPDHTTFLVTALVVVVFLYLSVTSFWRARRR